MALAGFQIINKMLQDKDYGIVKRHQLDSSYFFGCEDEFNFIVNHYKQYGNIPDKLTFLEKFQKYTLTEVNETEEYLIDKLEEERGYQGFCNFFSKFQPLLQSDSRQAYYYWKEHENDFKPRVHYKGTDLFKDAEIRYREYEKSRNNPKNRIISTGLAELDEIIDGFKLGEELVIVVARTAHGKSFIATKLCYEASLSGVKVGYYSGEMSDIDLGYRFDTLNGHFPNTALKRGAEIQNYKEYIENLSKEDKFYNVITPKDFGFRPTVQQIRNYIEEYDIGLMCIDQLSLIEDGRAKNNDPLRIKMANITQDLYSLSTELKIPIILLVQANREATKRDKTPPQLEDIKESDDISHNCSKCISLAKNGDELTIQILKNRDGKSGQILKYYWDVNNGFFEYIPSDNDGQNVVVKRQIIQKEKDEMDNAITKCPF